ncbi:MAG: type II toxin-antitoxin system PemK/MazF family toxin [Defluviitaleaceae bacterium]|nr:type II toxin-antitoxin system PemK/MazF family toxin [Defluviitaleaceae bacterium]
MVKQGDIIWVNFDPQSGREQAGHRPAVVVSNDLFIAKTQMAIVCPITNTNNSFPLHIKLDSRTATTGFILCEHVKSMDLTSRGYRVIEPLPEDLLQQLVSVVFSELALPQ